MIRFVRVWLPVGVCSAGLAILAVRRDFVGLEAAAALAGAGLAIAFLNTLHRIGVSGDRDRDDEETARRYYDEHGRWPDE